MSRIRSIHPGLFTDEAFMSASISSRVLIIGLWTEAWDDGVFEWKPLTLKARIFPVDSVDVLALLSELADLGFLKRFDAEGKAYGAIRNFRKWQRPKFPNSSKVLPESLVLYVGLEAPITEALPKPSGSSTVKPPQMEEVGCRKGEEKEEEEKKDPLSEVPSDDEGEGDSEKPKKRKLVYSEGYLEFWKQYPTDAVMSKKEGFSAWKNLDTDDRALAMRGIPALIEHQRKNPTYRMVHACRYLSQRRFDGLAEPAEATPDAPLFATTEDWFANLRARRSAAGAN